METGFKNRENYKGLWDEESLQQEIRNFFQYCAEYCLKPSKAGLQLWLGVSRQTYNEWSKDKIKYGFKSDLIEMANQAMEIQYIERSESFPTGNIFLLKTSHGYIETQKVEVTNGVNAEDVKDMVSKLGLDKPSE